MAAQNYTLRYRDGTVTTIVGVLSQTVEQVTIYDLSNYRNTLDAATIGRAWIDTPSLDPSNTPPTYAENYDDVLDGTAPHKEEKQRTFIVFWSGAAGTGDVLGKVWHDELRGYSIGTYTRV